MLLGWCSGCEVGREGEREGSNDWVDGVYYMLYDCQ